MRCQDEESEPRAHTPHDGPCLLSLGIDTDECVSRSRAQLFSDQDRVPFHHLPEYVNRFIGPAAPTVIAHTIHVNREAGADQQASFDVEIGQDDGTRQEFEKVHERLAPTAEGMRALAGLDEKVSGGPPTSLIPRAAPEADSGARTHDAQIALDATATRSALLKRSFLTSFAASPAAFLDDFLASQSADLSLLLASQGDRGAQSAVGGGADWRESTRWGQFWQGEWVEEAGGVWSRRDVEGKIRAKGAERAAAGRGGR